MAWRWASTQPAWIAGIYPATDQLRRRMTVEKSESASSVRLRLDLNSTFAFALMTSIPDDSSPSLGLLSAADAVPGDTVLCVFYDGGCPLCRAEIAGYQQAEGGDSMRWVDASRCRPAELGPGLDPARALARLHVRRSDGTLVQGAAAFAEIWTQLPKWRWLGRLARLPLVLPLLEAVYTVFLLIRPLWRGRAAAASAIPRDVMRQLRTDHAGETGAVMIYRGVLSVSRHAELRAFARHHLETEQRHLQLVEAVVPSRSRSWLLPLWRVSGWLTGALPALVGPRAVFATIQAVETFVDRHYEAQIQQIDALIDRASASDPDPLSLRPLTELQALLTSCRQDEIAHRDDARSKWDGMPGTLMRVWLWLVRQGSEKAVLVCRHV